MSVPVASILPGDSPRLDGENQAHVRLLAETADALPPIIVHRPTMRVIDGTHRLSAAKLRRQAAIDVQFFEGTAEEAFVLAVSANVAHGRPMTLADRKAAASRILGAYPDWSDRRIATATGISHRTVAAIRARAGGQNAQLNGRIGIDGKVHPLTNCEGRRAAAELIRIDATASLREVAKKAGISPGTVRDVRARLYRGEEPVPSRNRRTPTPTGEGIEVNPVRDRAHRDNGLSTGDQRGAADLALKQALQRLRADPAMRFNDNGRALIRLLGVGIGAVRDYERLVTRTPSHCRSTVAAVAAAIGKSWTALATAMLEAKSQAPEQDCG